VEDIISRIFSLLPVVLLIIWVIQFIERGRRQRKARQQTAEKKEPAKDELSALMRGASRKRSGTLPRTGELTSMQSAIYSKSRQVAGAAAGARKTDSLNSLNLPPSPVKEAKSDKLSGRKPMAPSGSSEQGTRVVKDREISAESSAISARQTSLDGIRARSPLAQAMLWKIIFDRPSALREPDE